MEEFIITVLILILAFVSLGFIFGIIALVKIAGHRRRLDDLERWRRTLPRPAPMLGGEPRLAGAPRAAPIPPLPPPPTPRVPSPIPIPSGPVGAPPSPTLETLTTLRRDFEKKLGQRWMTWAGALLILMGVAFFVRQALTWAGPVGRVTTGVVLAVVLLVAGDRFVRRGWRALGQGLMGAGLGSFYVSFFAAFSLYHLDLVPQETAFAAMALCTAAGMTLAILHDAPALAIVALLGGFLTPVMLSTGKDARDALFSYLLMLNLGVIGVAFFKKWTWLDVLAFVGTVVLYVGWFNEFYKPPAMVPALLWLGGFYTVFLVLPFLYHLLRSEPAPWPRFVMALADAAFGFTTAWVILKQEHLKAAGFVALGMTACYVAMGTLSRKRITQDVRQTLGFLALAVGFLVLAAPLHFGADGIILSWTIDAPVLLFLAYRYRYRPLRFMALLVLALVTFYGLVEAWPSHTALFLPILNRRFLTAIAPTLGAAVFSLLHWREKELAETVDNHVRGVVACAAGVLALVLVHAESAEWFRHKVVELSYRQAEFYHTFAPSLYVFLWTVGAAVCTALGLRLHSLKTRVTGVLVLGVSFSMLLYLMACPPREPYLLFLNVRFLAMLLNVAAAFGTAWVYWRHRDLGEGERPLARILAVAAAALLLIVLSVESHNFSSRVLADTESAHRLALTAVSVVWGLYAFALLALGFAKRLAPVRYAGLALFGLTVLKVVVLDTSRLKDVYRWITYLAIGFLLVAGSYLYYRLERLMSSSSKETPQ